MGLRANQKIKRLDSTALSCMTNAELVMYADTIAREKTLGNEVFMPALLNALMDRIIT